MEPAPIGVQRSPQRWRRETRVAGQLQRIQTGGCSGEARAERCRGDGEARLRRAAAHQLKRCSNEGGELDRFPTPLQRAASADRTDRAWPGNVEIDPGHFLTPVACQVVIDDRAVGDPQAANLHVATGSPRAARRADGASSIEMPVAAVGGHDQMDAWIDQVEVIEFDPREEQRQKPHARLQAIGLNERIGAHPFRVGNGDAVHGCRDVRVYGEIHAAGDRHRPAGEARDLVCHALLQEGVRHNEGRGRDRGHKDRENDHCDGGDSPHETREPLLTPSSPR